MFVTNYYLKLVSYRDLLDKKITKGKMDINKGNRLVAKLNEWNDQADLKGFDC